MHTLPSQHTDTYSLTPSLSHKTLSLSFFLPSSFFSPKVFYERDLIDLIPTLLRQCNWKVWSRWMVADLVETAHVVIKISERAAADKMLVLGRRRKTKGAKKKGKGIQWKSEEVRALVAGVGTHGVGRWNEILKDR